MLKSQLREHEVTKERQKNKFSCLLNTSGMNSNQPTSGLASECMQKWVTNCSQRILSDPELSVLKKGLNFAMTPKKLPVVDLITATESACRNLNSSDANELRAKVVNTIGKHGNINDQSITKKERKAIEDLRKDENVMILPADKGRTTVVMVKQEYLNKCNSMLQDTKTYKKLKHDPTAKYKRELAALLKELKDREVISNTLHKRLYPTSDQPHRFYGVPKTHKINMPLCPIVSTIGSITYETAKYLAEVLSPLVGQTEFHVKNSKDFAENITGLKIEADEELRSYDITALFTSVPIDKALAIIRSKLMEDSSLADKTTLQPEDIIRLLEQCLKCTYFVFQGQHYQQIHGAAMGSPVSPIVCNLYMETFEQRALATAPHPPRFRKRYADDTCTILKREYSEEFTEHLNSINPENIQWTSEGEGTNVIPTSNPEETETERILAFLDTETIIQGDNSIKTRVYTKKTHTNQYLNFNSNHPLDHKKSVVRTLLHRADTLISNEEDRQEEIKQIQTALQLNGYLNWVLDSSTNQNHATEHTKQPTESGSANSTSKTRSYAVQLPYVKGLTEPLCRLYKQYEVSSYVRPSNTLR